MGVACDGSVAQQMCRMRHFIDQLGHPKMLYFFILRQRVAWLMPSDQAALILLQPAFSRASTIAWVSPSLAGSGAQSECLGMFRRSGGR